jgi:tetratricopeptide (TPR) repeat protein
VGEPPQLFAVLSGLHAFYGQQGQYQTAHELSEQLLNLAQRQHDPARLVGAHWRMGQSLFWLGELSAARSYLEQVIALDAPQQHPAVVYSSVRSAAVGARTWAAVVL